MTIEYLDSKRIVGLSKSTTVANTKSISSQTTNVIDLAVKPDGTEIYVATEDTGKIITYELATAGDVSTAVYNSSKDYTHSLTNPKGMDWNNDGTKIYLASFNSEAVHTYTVSTAYDLSSTVTQVGTGDDLSGIDGAQALQWSHDGAYLFQADNSGVIHRYEVSTAFVVNDGTRTSFNPSETTAVTGISFGDNGKEMYIVSHANTGLFKYTLSTAYDLSTATHDSTLTTTDADNQGIATSNGKIYVLGQTTDIVTDYNNDIRPTNVQDNSILVEKDTGKIYWFDADPTYTTVEAGATADSNGGASYVTYKQITGLTAGDEISHVTFDVYNTPTDTSFKGGVYTESSSNPTTLLASGELTNQNVSNTYTTLSIPLTSNATVPSNGIVWVAIIPNKTNPLLRVSTASSSYTNSKFSTTSGSYTNYSNWMLSTASVQGAGENNVRFGVKIYHAPAWTNPKDFQGVSGLKLRLDASLGITGSSTVSAWADQSFKGDNNFVQATSGSQPTLTASNSSFNNKPTIDFDGSNDNMTCTFPTALTDDCSVYIVTNGSAGTDSVYFQGVTSTTYDQITFATNQGGGTKNYISNANATINGTSTASSSAVNTSACIFRLNYELNGKFYKDGTQVNVASNSLKAGIGVASLILGGRGDSGWSHGNIKIAEFLLFDHVLSDADNTLIMTYLEDKYSL